MKSRNFVKIMHKIMLRGQNLLGYALMMVRKQLDNRKEKRIASCER